MKKLIILLMVSSLFIGCETKAVDNTEASEPKKPIEQTEPVEPKEPIEPTEVADCVEFITLVSAVDVAKELGWTELKVVRDYQVNLWEKPSSQGKGRTVGKMRAGSHARLFDRNGSDYYVQSPLDKSKGWVSDVQVSGTVMKNPMTFEYCD